MPRNVHYVERLHWYGSHALGRNVNHDPRSLSFEHRGLRQPADVAWRRTVPAFDQGELGSCTGNALLGALLTAPFAGTWTSTRITPDEAGAVEIYHEATALDPYPGTYPPEDTGSDGTSVCQAAKVAGLIGGYTHALSLNAGLDALLDGPVITGVPWYDSMFSCQFDGKVTVDPSSGLAGGHEFEVNGVDVERRRVWCVQSWGESWSPLGNGAFFLTWDDWTMLLGNQGDVTVPIPLTKPAPVPTPPPGPPAPNGPSAEAIALGRALKHQEWDTRGHVGWSATVAKRGHAWRVSEGL